MIRKQQVVGSNPTTGSLKISTGRGTEKQPRLGCRSSPVFYGNLYGNQVWSKSCRCAQPAQRFAFFAFTLLESVRQ